MAVEAGSAASLIGPLAPWYELASHFDRCPVRTWRVVIAVSSSLISKEGYAVKRPEETRAVKATTLPKRKRTVAGPKVAPLIAMPMVPSLSDTEWQPFLQLLPARPQPELLRSELDRLMTTY